MADCDATFLRSTPDKGVFTRALVVVCYGSHLVLAWRGLAENSRILETMHHWMRQIAAEAETVTRCVKHTENPERED